MLSTMRLNLFFLAGLTLLLFSCTQTYIVTFSGSEGGSVSEIGGEYDEGTTVSVTATPTTGYEFQGWSDGSMQNPRTITVSESINLTALFSKQQLSLNVSIQGEGSVVDSNGNSPSIYEFGADVSLEAVPDIGYEFQGWSDGSMQNPRALTITESLNLIAIFTKQAFEIIVVTEGEGVVVDQNGELPGMYDFGADINLKAQPAKGYYFTGWEYEFSLENLIEDSNAQNNPQISSAIASFISSFYSFEAEYLTEIAAMSSLDAELNKLEEELNSFNNLAFNRDYSEDEILKVIESYTLKYDDIKGLYQLSDTDFPLAAYANFSITAKFEKIESLYIMLGNEGGRVKVGNSPSSKISFILAPYNSQHQITAVSNEGWDFDNWGGDISSITNPLEIFLDNDLSELPTIINASFKKKKFDLNVSIEGDGSVSEEVVVQSGQYDFETQVKLTAVPDENWEFINWSGDLTSTENPVIIEVNNTKSITAKFAKKDSDKDGVPDDIDQCPDTPEGSLVDELGCPTDLNNNGIPDDLEGDADNDGVIDYYDECSNTTPGASVDSKGCAVVDQVFLFSGAVSTVVLNNNVSGTISFSIRNNLDEPIQLESLKVYDGDSGFLRATADRNTNPELFPSLSPGQSHSLQSTFNSFIFLPMYYWRFTYKGQVYEVSKRWSLTSGQTKPYNSMEDFSNKEWDKKVVSFELTTNKK